ncbi:MAG: Gfo/Idh/MocA family oxidoreductase [Candidatus Lokiarchaeota archaeon]|nr:Gfo/Idh/MocA family oxidoreductase [Candidatus Lokiarchaeota archaeon]
MGYVKYGVCGCGTVFDTFHSLGAVGQTKYKFTAFYDLNEKKAHRLARRYKGEHFADLDSMLNSDIDAVLINVPHHLHRDKVIQAAEAGVHVLCEKPMAPTLEECDEMIAATKKADVKFMIAENHRFLPAHKYIADTVHKGLIGNVFLIRAYEGVNEIPGLTSPGWKGDIKLRNMGALLDMGVHRIATTNWILNDEIEMANCWVTKQCTSLDTKAEDSALVMYRYISGTIMQCTVSFTVISPPSNELQIYGTKGTIIENHALEYPLQIFSDHPDMGANRNRWHIPTDIEHGPFPQYYKISMGAEDLHFAECILNDTEPEFTPQQAKKTIEAVLMAYESANRNKPVTIDKLLKLIKEKGSENILKRLKRHIQKNYHCIDN